MATAEDRNSEPSVSILVPLYQYPIKPLTWQPLFEAISNCSSTSFIVIINPNSGPGVDPDGWQPDKRYSRGIAKLKTFPNVTLVGYVRLDYCRRSCESVRKDIEKYAAWSQLRDIPTGEGLADDLSMRGVFFDEVPNLFTKEAADQLASYSRIVREAKGFGDDCWVIHNPGTIPDIEFLAYWTKTSSLSKQSSGQNDYSRLETWSGDSDSEQEAISKALESVPNSNRLRAGKEPDLVVIFEGPYSDWLLSPIQERIKRLSSYNRSQCCHIVHSVPVESFSQLLSETRVRGSHLYVTDLAEKFYELFGGSWTIFSSLVEGGNLAIEHKANNV